MRTVAIVPARYGSTRFPGKPLADINGKPMVWHVAHAAMQAEHVNAVYVATDDARIAEACQAHGLKYILTSPHHATGTDRLAECISSIDADLYVNVQGDEPMISALAIDSVARAMQHCDDQNTLASNGYATLADPHEVMSQDVVKVTLTAKGNALSFSRLAIPCARGHRMSHCKQLGLYCFRRKGLELFSTLPPGPVERSESVEMLRFLEHGYQVRMVEVDHGSVAVDTPADLERVRLLMAQPKAELQDTATYALQTHEFRAIA
jgi:3-deoxy-manno-octulosonate cytidylyltransferase (CMP-KDO synthetase)